MQKDGPYVGFQRADFDVNSDFSVGEDGLILMKLFLDKAIVFFISGSHLASGVIGMPKNLKVPICFILSPLQIMLHTGMCDCSDMTMDSVYFAFS